MSIIICRRRILRCSSIFSWGDWGVGGELSVWWEDSSLRPDSLDPMFDSPSCEFTLLALLRILYPNRRQGNTKKVWLPRRQRMGAHRVTVEIERRSPHGVSAEGPDMIVLQASQYFPFWMAIG